MRKLEHILLLLIVFFAFILRIVALDKFPPALNWDEISHGYNAYSILHTGQDEWGKFLPLTNFRAYGDYPLPLNLYLTMPFITIFGLNELSLRFPHVILGTLTVLAAYFLTFSLTKSKKKSLVVAFLAAVEPWLFFPSRFVVQSNLSVLFLTASVACMFLIEKRKWMLPLSILLLGFSVYSYHSTRILAPLILITLGILFRKNIVNIFKSDLNIRLITIIIALMFFVPLPFILANPESRARSNEVFLIDQGMINRINENRNASQLASPLKTLIHNKATYFTAGFIKNYIGYFSPYYLFMNGGTQYQFSIPGRGLLYLVNLPFFYFGLLIMIAKALKDKKYAMLFFWLILAPLPAAITREQYAVIRSTTMLPIPQILTSLGLFSVLDKVSAKSKNTERFSVCFYVILVLISAANYLTDYFSIYPKNYSQAWQYGYEEAAEYISDNYAKYDKIIMTKKYGEPHEYLLFYGGQMQAPWSWQPHEYRSDINLVRYFQSNWYWVDSFDKFIFVNDWDLPNEGNTFITERKNLIDCNKIHCLLVTSPEYKPGGWKFIKDIRFLNSQTVFELYEN